MSPHTTAATASAVMGASRMPLRKWPVARCRPAIAVGPMSGFSSAVVGRKFDQKRPTAAPASAGTVRPAVASSDDRAPAVT